LGVDSNSNQHVAFSDPMSRRLNRIALTLLTLGLLWRTVRYFLAFPIWGDEALVSMNFVWFDYGELTRQLHNGQIAPLLFLWGERTAFVWLGPGELSMRLLPFLAGIISLGLYWRLTGLILSPRARMFAVGFLAVAVWPVALCNTIKPYSLDLLMALALCLPAVEWLRRPDQRRWLAVLVAVTPVAMLSSYPTAFVAGGVGLVLLGPAWRGGWTTRFALATFGVVLLASFALACRIGDNQLATATSGVTTRDGMAAYWKEAGSFPPSHPLAAIKWVVVQLVGHMSAYPVGGASGASILTVICCVAGFASWIRGREWVWPILFGVPLFLNFIAAALHRYPFGAGRLSQFLAPAICTAAGCGVAAMIERVNWPAARQMRWTNAVAGLLIVVGLAGLTRDIVKPYRDAGCEWMRMTHDEMSRQMSPNDAVVVCAGPDQMECIFSWYWLNDRHDVTWDFRLPESNSQRGRIWGFHAGRDPDFACQRLAAEFQQRDPTWQLVKRVPYVHEPNGRKDLPQRCELFCFEKVTDRSAMSAASESNR
jgi:hypothetical protein